jgi:outer membrane protein TolC
VNSSVSLSIAQPLLENFKIDEARHRLDASKADREATDYQLQATVVQTTRNVKNAYWDLAVLSDNEKRVAAATMASLDIVEAQSEVARNRRLRQVACGPGGRAARSPSTITGGRVSAYQPYPACG